MRNFLCRIRLETQTIHGPSQRFNHPAGHRLDLLLRKRRNPRAQRRNCQHQSKRSGKNDAARPAAEQSAEEVEKRRERILFRIRHQLFFRRMENKHQDNPAAPNQAKIFVRLALFIEQREAAREEIRAPERNIYGKNCVYQNHPRLQQTLFGTDQRKHNRHSENDEIRHDILTPSLRRHVQLHRCLSLRVRQAGAHRSASSKNRRSAAPETH